MVSVSPSLDKYLKHLIGNAVAVAYLSRDLRLETTTLRPNPTPLTESILSLRRLWVLAKTTTTIADPLMQVQVMIRACQTAAPLVLETFWVEIRFRL
jgi:hypothetical protein